MIRKLLLVSAVMLLALTATVAVLYGMNGAPVVPGIAAGEAGTKPYVIKMHARWCPYCMLTKDEWADVERTYSGRVHFLVFDFTTAAATQRSRTEAQRLGLEAFFDEYEGATGLVVVLDGATRAVTAEIGGNRSFEEYRAAIDAVLDSPR